MNCSNYAHSKLSVSVLPKITLRHTNTKYNALLEVWVPRIEMRDEDEIENGTLKYGMHDTQIHILRGYKITAVSSVKICIPYILFKTIINDHYYALCICIFSIIRYPNIFCFFIDEVRIY